MNVYGITIALCVILILIYICDMKKFCSFITNHYLLIILLGLISRIFFMANYGHSTDMSCFKSWAQDLYLHGLSNFYSLDTFKDYPPGYMYILYLIGAIKNHFTLTDTEFTFLIKLPAVIFDIATSILVYKFSSKHLGSKLSFWIALSYVLNPAVIFNSAVWGQVDSIYTFFIFISIYFMTQEKYLYSFLNFTIAFLIKPQALMFAPIFIYAIYEILSRNRFNKRSIYLVLQYFFCSALILFTLILPFTKKFDFAPVLNQYKQTLASYPYATVNAFNSFMYAKLNWVNIGHSGISIVFTVTEIILIATITLFAIWFLINNTSKSKYFFAAALINICVFVFTFKMHERYIFPAMILLLMSFSYSKLKRNFMLYAGFSITCFINLFTVYYEYMANKNSDAFSITAQIFSVANVILALISIYHAKNYSIQNEIEIKNTAVKNFKILPAENIEPTRKLSKMQKKDWLIVSAITILYALLAFFNLGNLKSPQTFWFANKNDCATISFDKPCNIKRIQILNGIRPDKKIDIYKSSDQNNWTLAHKIDLKGVSSVFTWKDENVKINNVQFIKIVCRSDETYLQEMAFRDEHNKILPVKIISGNAQNLFDEQNLVPLKRDYMNSMYFDEVYHARTAYEFLHHLKVYETTHPPLGKDFIALGIKIFGMTPFGWRFSGTLFGVLMLPIFYLLAKKIFSRTMWASFATILFSLEFMHFEQTRIATIDSYTVFFILLMYLAMYIYYNTNFHDVKFSKSLAPLVLCAIFSGFAIASKWQGFYALAGLAVLFFAVIFLRYKEFLYAKKYDNDAIVKKFSPLASASINTCIILIFLITLPIYFLSYFMFIKTPGVNGFLGVLKNQDFMFSYHAFLNATHPFSSKWWQWILNLRPILFYNNNFSPDLRAGISCFANPLICYGGLVGFFYCIAKLSKKFDKDIFFLIVGYVAQLLPWVFITRLTFAYHYFPCIPFLILLFTYFIKDYLYPKFGKKILVITICLTAILFFMFYPVISGMPISTFYINTYLKWFSTWQLT